MVGSGCIVLGNQSGGGPKFPPGGRPPWLNLNESTFPYTETSSSHARERGLSLSLSSSLTRKLFTLPLIQVTNFYDYAGEGEEGEEDMEKWILQQPNRGAIRYPPPTSLSLSQLTCCFSPSRVYQPGSSYSETVCCTTDTTADTIIARSEIKYFTLWLLILEHVHRTI